MTIEHYITKRIVPGTRKVWFRFEKKRKMKTEVAIAFRTAINTDLYNLKVTLEEKAGFFYVDVPRSVWSFTSYFYVIWKNANGIEEKKVFLSGKYEDLYEKA